MRCLMMLVLIGLVGQTIGFKEFNLKRSEKLELEDLLKNLGGRLPGRLGTKYENSLNPEAHMVADLLAETADKKAEVFNHITIKQLLALNDWTLDDCTEVKLEGRRKICLQLCTEKETLRIDQILRNAPQPLKGNEAVPYNLGTYCWHLLKQVKRKCSGAQLKEAINHLGGWFNVAARRLSVLNQLVKKHIARHKIPVRELAANGDDTKYMIVVEEVFDKMVEEVSDREDFKRLCQQVVEKLGEFLQAHYIGGELRDYMSLCTVIIHLEEEDI